MPDALLPLPQPNGKQIPTDIAIGNSDILHLMRQTRNHAVFMRRRDVADEMAVDFTALHRNGVVGVAVQVERDIGLIGKQLRHGFQIHGVGFAVLYALLYRHAAHQAQHFEELFGRHVFVADFEFGFDAALQGNRQLGLMLSRHGSHQHTVQGFDLFLLLVG